MNNFPKTIVHPRFGFLLIEEKVPNNLSYYTNPFQIRKDDIISSLQYGNDIIVAPTIQEYKSTTTPRIFINGVDSGFILKADRFEATELTSIWSETILKEIFPEYFI